MLGQESNNESVNMHKRNNRPSTRPKVLIKGIASNSDNSKFLGNPKTFWLFVGNVNRETTDNDIKSYIISNTMNIIPAQSNVDISKLSDSSYRIGISECVYNCINNPEFWSKNVKV